MSFLFGHLIGALIAGKGYEYFSKKKNNHYTWFFLLAGAIIPDLDFFIDWTLGTHLHRTFTHSLLFVLSAPVILFLILKLFLNKNNQHQQKYFSIALGAGILTHLFLDLFSARGVPLFWPSLVHFSSTHVGYYNPATPAFLNGSPAEVLLALKLAIADMAVGAAWLFYLWWKKKVEF